MKQTQQIPAWMHQEAELSEDALENVAGGACIARYAFAAIQAGANKLKEAAKPLAGPIKRPRC